MNILYDRILLTWIILSILRIGFRNIRIFLLGISFVFLMLISFLIHMRNIIDELHNQLTPWIIEYVEPRRSRHHFILEYDSRNILIVLSLIQNQSLDACFKL